VDSCPEFLELQSPLESAARQAAGNWREFQSFCWTERPDDSDSWTIVNTRHRDSGLIEISNAEAIEQELREFGDDVRFERHHHWLVGWVGAVCVRVYDGDLGVTPAFTKLIELQKRAEDYPVLDEEDWCARSFEAACDRIQDVGHPADDAPKDWDKQVYRWLWDNNQRELDDVDDQGPYPSGEAVDSALEELGWLDPEYGENDDEG
jgi:hypothetical protein